MFRVFLAFSIFFAIDITQLNPGHTLAFLEFLVFNQVSQASINNYLSGVKTMLQLYGIQTSALRDYRVSYFTKALKLKAPLRVSFKTIIDIPTLNNIVSTCDSMYMGQIYKACFLTSFFSFLRISNLVPTPCPPLTPLSSWLGLISSWLLQGLIFSSNGVKPSRIKTLSESSRSLPWVNHPSVQSEPLKPS